MTRSATSWFSRNEPDCQSIASTSVVLPWSTCATIATFRRSVRVALGTAGGYRRNTARPAVVGASVHIAELWRYPVKSMRGEQVETTRVELDGIPGDRIVHAVQGDGRVVTSRFRPGLLALSATLAASGEPLV